MGNKQSNYEINHLRRSVTKAAWAAPIVTAITLPAHAQTSTTTTPECSPNSTLVYPGYTVRCGDPASEKNVCVQIEASGTCDTTYTTVEYPDSFPVSGDFFSYVIRLNPNNARAPLLSLRFGGHTTPRIGFYVSQFCDSSTKPDQDFSVSMIKTATDGTMWQTEVRYTFRSTFITLHDMVFTRV